MQLLHSEFPPKISFKFKVLFKHCINSASITNLTFVIGLLCVSEGKHQLYTDKIPQSKHTETYWIQHCWHFTSSLYYFSRENAKAHFNVKRNHVYFWPSHKLISDDSGASAHVLFSIKMSTETIHRTAWSYRSNGNIKLCLGIRYAEKHSSVSLPGKHGNKEYY